MDLFGGRMSCGFMVSCANILVDFICYCVGLVLG